MVVTTPFAAGDTISRVRIVHAGPVWNVLLQGTHVSTGLRAHHLIQAAPRVELGARQLDSTMAPWANADVSYVPEVGTVVVWFATGSNALTACVLDDAGACIEAPSFLGVADDAVPSIGFDGADELAVVVSHGAPRRLRTFFVSASNALDVRGSHDDAETVVGDPAFVLGRAGRWVVLARSSSSRVRVLSGARLESADTHDLAMPRSVDWTGNELTVLAGGTVLFGSSGPVTLRRYVASSELTPVDVALPITNLLGTGWNHALGVARASRTRAIALGTVGSQTHAARVTFSDCPVE